jgi:hypothetical protein
MNYIQQVIRDYHLMSEETRASAVHEFHIEQEKACGCAVKGHKSTGWSLKETAKAFNVSIGRASMWLKKHRETYNGTN